MCIVAVAWQCFTELPVLIASNRDEYFDRQTKPLHAWQDLPIVAGRDMRSGGTWLGVHENNGRWATVLNVRQQGQAVPEESRRRSRGELVTQFLASSISAEEYVQSIVLENFEGFNFICGDTKQAFIVSNRGQKPQSLQPGLHVFSNGAMTDSVCSDKTWFKCKRLHERISTELFPILHARLEQKKVLFETSTHMSDADILEQWHKVLFACLHDTIRADIDHVPNTGFPAQFEQMLSSVYIHKLPVRQGYGTRVSSLVALSAKHHQFITV